jgi:hypothetical protein
VLRLRQVAVATGRPGWLTAGALRLGLLAVFIVAVGMVRPRLTDRAAGILVLVAIALVVAGALLFLGSTRRLAERLHLHGVTDPVLVQIRLTGLPLLGLTFFLFWTMVYVGLWWFHPETSFAGLDRHPRFADFFYYAVSTAFISPPGDIFAHSRGTRSATMIEMLTAFALLTTYLSSFVDWQRAAVGRADRPDPADD